MPYIRFVSCSGYCHFVYSQVPGNARAVRLQPANPSIVKAGYQKGNMFFLPFRIAFFIICSRQRWGVFSFRLYYNLLFEIFYKTGLFPVTFLGISML